MSRSEIISWAWAVFFTLHYYFFLARSHYWPDFFPGFIGRFFN